MGVVHWRGLLGPPSLLISTALVIAAVVPAAIAAGPLRPSPVASPPCPPPGLLAETELSAARGAQVNARIAAQALLSTRGEETGRRLAVEPAAGSPLDITLPAESFVAGPFGGILLYGSHTSSSGSEIRAVALETGCDQRLATPADVVRSAVMDASGRFVYIHSVTADERQDGGVVRHDIVTGEQVKVVPPLPYSEEYGPTFATSLVWSVTGDELAVQSCGFSRCRTRVLDVTTGAVQAVTDAGHGALLGLDRQRLYAYDACHWSPCDVLAIERGDGGAGVIAEDAYDASLTAIDDGAQLLIETSAGRREVKP
jgi:hypothetical protein